MCLAKAMFFVVIGLFGRIAQSVEQLPFKQTVGGSNPSAPTKQKKNPFFVYNV